MKRLIFSACAALLWMTVLPGAARADDTLKRVQQSLRDQGFYYGTIDGAPGDETTQAIRRYQIRNGLQVSGQLDEASRASILRNGGATTGSASPGTSGGSVSVAPSGSVRPRSTPPPLSTPRPAPAATPARTTVPSLRADPEEDGGFHRGPGPANPPVSRSASRRDDDEEEIARPGGRRDLRAVPPNGIAPSATLSSLFADTPFEFAPPPVQADTLRRAQNRLLRQGFYDRLPDGRPNALTTEALSNFQGFNRLRRTGRLDTATLAAMRLLPGRGRGGPGVENDDEEPRRGPRPGGVYEGRVVQ